jgi:uncharacterized membrane protein
MLEYLTRLNDHNLPYPDTIHPIVVHFVIAIDTSGILTRCQKNGRTGF